MQLTAEDGAIRARAPAKVNLALEVLGKRDDGFHELDMANVTVSLYDEIVVRREAEPGITCTVDVPSLPTDGRNLAVRAAQLLVGARPVGLHIAIRKRIPAGAGLAGGSSDAAATLVAVDRLLGLQTAPERLAELAAELGADVPYLLHGGAARCRGRGELVEPHPCPVGLPMVIVWPREELATSRVYGALSVPLTPLIDRASVLFARLNEGPGWTGVGGLLFNRLEHPARQLCPVVGVIAESLQSVGSQGVVMTGSGSAMVSLVPTVAEAERVAATVLERHACETFVVTLVAG